MMGNDELYELTDPLLIAALWGKTICERKFFESVGGYFQANIDRVGRAVFAFLCRKTFGIFRLPGSDVYESDTALMTYFEEYDITEEEIDRSCRALKEMADFVQKKIAESGRVRDGKVSLMRSVRKYEFEHSKIEPPGTEDRKIKFFSNVFTSFSHGRLGLGAYNGVALLPMRVDLSDIVYWDDYVTKPDTCKWNKSAADCEQEVLVLCRSFNGYKELKESGFILEKGKTIDEYIMARVYEPSLRGSVFSAERSWLFPCQRKDFLTRFTMERDMKIIRNEYSEFLAPDSREEIDCDELLERQNE